MTNETLITLDNLRRFKELLGEGTNGKSAYEVAVDNGFKGTETEWLETLRGATGAKGDEGLSAYESAKLGGYKGTMSEFYALLSTLDNITVDVPECIYKGSDEPTDEGIQYWLDTSVSPALLKYKDEFDAWNVIAGGSGGGTGGGEGSAELTLTPEWLNKTIAYGNDCILNYEWSSIRGGNPTGMGTFALYVTTAEGEEKKESYRVAQGKQPPLNLTSYLALGDTEIIIRVTDRYGNVGEAILSIKTVKLSLTESFDESTPYTSRNITYYCTPSGAKGKTKRMYIILDGNEENPFINGDPVDDDNVMQTYSLTVDTHGTHSIRAYFTCELEEGEEPIKSEEVYSEFAYIGESETVPIITTNCGVNELEEFDSVNIGWYVFTPNGDGTTAAYTPLVEIYENIDNVIPEGATPKKTIENVEFGTMQEYIFKAEKVGANYILFKVGDIVRPVLINVQKSTIDVNATSTNLQLYLTPRNQTQGSTKWVSETVEGRIEATLENFNYDSDGFLIDGSGKSEVLRLSDEAKLTIPVEIFTDTIKTTGVTIEFEIATHDVLDYEAEIIKCMNSGVGITVTANQATLKTKENTITTPFREGEQVRVSFVIESSDTSTKLLLIYINGVLSGATNYNATSDDFTQSVVQGITVGSKLCTTDIYAIRVYSAALSREHILDNWIADTQDRELLLERYKRNDIFDDVGISPDRLPEGLPYMVFFTNEDGLPQVKEKGAEKYLNGKFVDPTDPERCFTFTNAQLKVQGTSSSGYPRKNFTMTFDKKEGITLNGKKVFAFQINDSSLPTNSFCFKADYASSEGANNVELIKLFNDICPVKTPPQEADNRVRQGIDGFPMVIFCYYDNAYYFVGKYNFNNDKGTPEVFGMTDGVESWEITGNGTAMGEYKEDDLSTLVTKEETDKATGEITYTVEEKWKDTFEARYPDKYEDIEKLQEMVSWVRSTWRQEANPNIKLTETKTYGAKTYEYDTVEYRKAKFINEASDYFNIQHLCFFYLFTSFFLMIDNREKNTFPTRYLDGLWYFLPYDFDSAIGINNSGELVFGHGLEDIDEGIFNGAESVLWCNVRDYFADEIEAMYVKLRSDGLLTYEDVVRRFTNHQRAWGEAVFNEDSYYKYIAVMLGKDPTARYLPMLQGSKEAQRNFWLYNRFKYFDSKYVTKDALANPIIIRPNKNADIVITPYADTYLAINFDRMSGTYKPTPKRAYKGKPVTFSNPKADPQNAVVHIYNSSQITDLGDLSGQDTSEFDGRGASRLQRLIIGSDSIINEKFLVLSLANNKLLKLINVKNCPNLTGSVDITGCSGIEEVYFEGTGITSLVLPRGGSLRALHLPETVNNLTVINHKVTDFSMPNYSNLSTLWLELNETSKSTFDLKAILKAMVERLKNSEDGELGRLRVTGFELTGNKAFDTAQEILDLYTDLRKHFRGMDSNGNASQDETYLKNMLEGTIEVKESPILGTQLVEMQRLFPRVKIAYTKVQSTIFFYHDEEHTRLFNQQIVYDNGNAQDPTITLGKVPTYYEPTTDNNNGTEDEFARYVYTGWSDSLENITAVREVHAIYRRDLKYKRTFYDKDGKFIKVNGNEVNIYYAFDGENEVIEPPDHADYTTEDNGVTWYHEFIGWTENNSTVQASKQVPDVKAGDKTKITYVPVFTPKRVYKVNYYDETTEIGTDYYFYGDSLKTPVDPTKDSDNFNYYTFSHWELEDGTKINNFNSIILKGDMSIKAVFDAHTIYYTVRFKKHYGDPLQVLPTSYPYSTTYDEYYTGATSWSYTSPRVKTETVQSWKVSTSYTNGVYYLDYTASLYTEEAATISVKTYNLGAYNTGEVKYVCDGNESTSRGFNIGVIQSLQSHHYIRLSTTISSVPNGTVFNDAKVTVLTNKAGYVDGVWNYTCRFRCYFTSYDQDELTYSNISGSSASGYLINDKNSGAKTISLDKSTLSTALSWMTSNNSRVNAGDLSLTIEGSNIYVKEVYLTLCYTT